MSARSIQLKPFDVISFRFSDLGFSSRFHIARLVLLSYYCLHFIVVKSNYSLLSTEGKRELIKDFLEHGLSVNSSHSKFDLLVDFYLDSFNRYSRKNLKKQNKIEKIIYQVNDNKTNKKFYKNTKLNLKKSLEFYKETFFKLDVEYFMTPLLTKIHFQKNNIFFNEFEEFLGFFSNNFRGDSLEININGDYIDIVFLGFFDEDVYINSNRKYLLHYLY